MATNHYVSTQRGDDLNDGLSPSTPWKTLTKALQIQPDAAGHTYINIGPGVYREKITLSYGGTDASHMIYWRGDPDCHYVVGDAPGIVRITGCDTQDLPTTGYVINGNSKANVEFHNFVVDGSSNTNVVYGGTGFGRTFKNCTFYGYNGPSGVNAVNCNSYCQNYGYACNSYNSISYGGAVGFYGGRTHNCLAYGSGVGFQSNSPASNCVASGSTTGFDTATASYCLAQFCGTGFKGGFAFGCRYHQCGIATDGTTTPAGNPPTASEALQVVPDGDPLNGARFRKRGYLFNAINFTSIAGGAIDLSAERVYAFNPTGYQVGIGRAVAVYVASVPGSGSIKVALQKNVSSTWKDQAYKEIPVTTLTAGAWNLFEFDQLVNEMDWRITQVSNTWRIAVSSTDAQAATIGAFSGTQPAVLIYLWDSGQSYSYDILDRSRLWPNGISEAIRTPALGPYETPELALDYSTFYATAPSIKVTGKGAVVLKVGTPGGQELTKTVQVKTDYTAQVRLRMDGQYVSSATTSAPGSWETLSVSYTPSADCVAELILENTYDDTTSVTYFSDIS